MPQIGGREKRLTLLITLQRVRHRLISREAQTDEVTCSTVRRLQNLLEEGGVPLDVENREAIFRSLGRDLTVARV